MYYDNDEIIQEQIDNARRDGYDAGIKYHIDFLWNANNNPFNYDDYPELYNAWRFGFDEAGSDS